MTRTNYVADEDAVCDNCGESATITLLADYADEVGYYDETNLCNKCADELEKQETEYD